MIIKTININEGGPFNKIQISRDDDLTKISKISNAVVKQIRYEFFYDFYKLLYDNKQVFADTTDEFKLRVDPSFIGYSLRYSNSEDPLDILCEKLGIDKITFIQLIFGNNIIDTYFSTGVIFLPTSVFYNICSSSNTPFDECIFNKLFSDECIDMFKDIQKYVIDTFNKVSTSEKYKHLQLKTPIIKFTICVKNNHHVRRSIDVNKLKMLFNLYKRELTNIGIGKFIQQQLLTRAIDNLSYESTCYYMKITVSNIIKDNKILYNWKNSILNTSDTLYDIESLMTCSRLVIQPIYQDLKILDYLYENLKYVNEVLQSNTGKDKYSHIGIDIIPFTYDKNGRCDLYKNFDNIIDLYAINATCVKKCIEIMPQISKYPGINHALENMEIKYNSCDNKQSDSYFEDTIESYNYNDAVYYDGVVGTLVFDKNLCNDKIQDSYKAYLRGDYSVGNINIIKDWLTYYKELGIPNISNSFIYEFSGFGGNTAIREFNKRLPGDNIYLLDLSSSRKIIDFSEYIFNNITFRRSFDNTDTLAFSESKYEDLIKDKFIKRVGGMLEKLVQTSEKNITSDKKLILLSGCRQKYGINFSCRLNSIISDIINNTLTFEFVISMDLGFNTLGWREYAASKSKKAYVPITKKISIKINC